MTALLLQVQPLDPVQTLRPFILCFILLPTFRGGDSMMCLPSTRLGTSLKLILCEALF